MVTDSLLRGPPVARYQPQRLAHAGTPTFRRSTEGDCSMQDEAPMYINTEEFCRQTNGMSLEEVGKAIHQAAEDFVAGRYDKLPSWAAASVDAWGAP